MYGEYPVPPLSYHKPRANVGLNGCIGIFVTLFIAACCVQWEKFSERGNLNRLMALSTVFFGITVTAVS